jgi:hypothetical protein
MSSQYIVVDENMDRWQNNVQLTQNSDAYLHSELSQQVVAVFWVVMLCSLVDVY